MDYENYMELYEAVYFFNRIDCCVDNRLPLLIGKKEIERLGIDENIYKAVMRILVVNHLLGYDGTGYILSNDHKARHLHILETIISEKIRHYTEMFDKAINEFQFFFDSISELEYEIYSRYNFQITFETGKEVAKNLDLANKKVLELGGNSGGLGAALLARNKDCLYTIVDTKIPCRVGNEFNSSSKLNITFIEGNVFELKLPVELYDYIILMNLLHDFNDVKCSQILRNCAKYCDRNTKFVIIEDILTSEFEPKEAIMHGLRLSVECRGGKQRTIGELESLFLDINFRLKKTIRLSNVHTMMVMGI